MKQLQKWIALLLVALLLLAGCQHPDDPTESEWDDDASDTENYDEPDDHDNTGDSEPLELNGYAVSSSTAEATQAGLSILQQGGNAVDAAVAVALALGVTEPYSSGLGGSGVMVVYNPAENKAYSLDYYARAGSSLENTDYVGVPGYLAGLQDDAVAVQLGDDLLLVDVHLGLVKRFRGASGSDGIVLLILHQGETALPGDQFPGLGGLLYVGPYHVVHLFPYWVNHTTAGSKMI